MSFALIAKPVDHRQNRQIDGIGCTSMVEASFEKWLSMIRRLDGSQRSQALHALALAEAAAATADALSSADVGPSHDAAGDDCTTRPTPQHSAVDESPLDKLGRDRIESFGCPHCSSAEIGRWGRAGGKPRYRCATCHKTFNPLTGTPLSGLHFKERWQDQAQAMIVGDTVSKAAERCNIAYTTAFRWRHRFLAALNLDKPQRLSGIVEADETFILESFKGKRGKLLRAPRKRGGKASKRGLSAEQIPVIVARDRSGATIDAVLPNLDIASMTTALGHVIASGAVLCCDRGKVIRGFASRARIKTHVLDAPGGPKPDAPQFHINNVNAYHGRLKEWMRRFHGVATDNLPNYLSWRRTLEAFSKVATPDAWIRAAAGLGPYQQGSG
jgi:transposase-like protein